MKYLIEAKETIEHYVWKYQDDIRALGILAVAGGFLMLITA